MIISFCSTMIALVIALSFAMTLVGVFGNKPRIVLLLGICGGLITLFILPSLQRSLNPGEPLSAHDLTVLLIYGILLLGVIMTGAILVAATQRWMQRIYTADDLPTHFRPHTMFAILDENGDVLGICTFENLETMMLNRPEYTCRLWNDLDEARIGI